MKQLAAIGSRSRCHLARGDEPKLAVDANVCLASEHWESDLRQCCAIRPVAEFAADLERPRRIKILLRLIGLIRPNGIGGFASNDGLFLVFIVALFGRWNQRGINDLAGHRNAPLL